MRHLGGTTYRCDCGWSGNAEVILFSRKHVLNLVGVLRSHVVGRPNMYRCKVCNNTRDLNGFGACLDSHRLFTDNVTTVSDVYREDVQEIFPAMMRRDVFREFLGLRSNRGQGYYGRQ